MGTTLRTCLFSLTALVAVAARADGASGYGQDDAAYRDTRASAQQQSEGYAAPDGESAGERGVASPRQAMSPPDAGEAGSASGEPRRQGESDWSRQEFLRNVWETP